jgi:hypothetical protein
VPPPETLPPWPELGVFVPEHGLDLGNNPLAMSQKYIRRKAIVSGKSQDCIACHTKQNPAIVASWHTSSHAERGVGCYECHRAEPGDPDGGIRIVAVDVEDGRLHSSGKVGRIRGRACLLGGRGKADLVVDDDVNAGQEQLKNSVVMLGRMIKAHDMILSNLEQVNHDIDRI